MGQAFLRWPDKCGRRTLRIRQVHVQNSCDDKLGKMGRAESAATICEVENAFALPRSSLTSTLGDGQARAAIASATSSAKR